MEVTYTITMDDYLALARQAVRRTPLAILTFGGIWVAVTGTLAVGAGVLYEYTDWWPAAVPCAALSFAFAVAYPYMLWRAVNEAYREDLEKADLRGVIGRITLILTEDSLTEITEVTRSESRWAGMLGVDAGEDHTVIWVTATNAAFLPRRAFQSGEQYRAVRDFAVARLKPYKPAGS